MPRGSFRARDTLRQPVALRRFYGRAFDDEVVSEPFAELRATGLETHVPMMCDFWETLLFRAGLYRGSALQAHREIHRRAPCRVSLPALAQPVAQHR